MCIFCSIAKHEIPASILYEDDEIMAFLDISQVTKGHTLVIPKQHVQNFLECEEATMNHLMIKAQELAKIIMSKTGAAGMNILSNINEAAGQSVPHFHLHLIPRYDESDACVIAFHDSEKQDLEAVKKLLTV